MTTAVPSREPQALQDFQRRLNVALEDASVDTDAVIALAIGQQGWLVSLRDLAETSICPALARTGSMPMGVMGVGNFRGKVNTVVSMPSLCGAQDEEFRDGGWTTVLHPRFDVSVALWWPQMLGLFPKSDFSRHVSENLPALCRAAWISADARVWHELDTERLLKEKLGAGDSAQEASHGP